MIRAFQLTGMLILLASSSFLSVAQQSIPVRVAPVLIQPIYERIPLNGSITSAKVAQLSVATSGLVVDIRVEEGSEVQQGDILLVLDAQLSHRQVEAAEAGVQRAELAVADAQRRLREAKALDRHIAESAVQDLQAEVAEDQALLNQAKADLAYQREVARRHRLSAPFSGVISAKSTELGEWLDPGDAVLELVAHRNLRIDFQVAEDYLSRLLPNARVIYRLDAAPAITREAPVERIVPVADPQTRTFLLRVSIQEIQSTMIPGASVQGWLETGTGRKAPVAPRDAVLRYPDGRVVVWTVEEQDGGSKARENVVVIGAAFDGLIEIREGLQSGQRVIIEGNEALQQGQQVDVVND